MGSKLANITVFLVVLAISRAQVDPPIISGISFRNESSAVITWRTTPQTNPSRFRVSVVSFTDPNTTQEWPAQIRRVNYDSLDTPYKQLETQSNYECFNLCIQDPDCAFVVRSSSPKGNNCLFKKDASKVTSANLDPDSEYALVEPYSNSGLINYLSSNDGYLARISVYDSVVKQWSNFSSSSTFSLWNRYTLSFTRTGVTAGTLSWLRAYPQTYSRFGLMISGNMTGYTEYTDINLDSLRTFEHPTRYFSIEDYSKFIVTTNQQACIDACFNQFDCVQLVYFSDDFKAQDGALIAPRNSCYLNKKLEMGKGIYRKTNTIVLHVRDLRNSIDLPNLDFGSWEFKLKTWTPYGVPDVNFEIEVYNITSASPVLGKANISKYMNITWKMPEPLGLKRAAFYYTINGSTEYTYVISASSDFIDSDQILIEAAKFNECFEACYQSQACLAYSYAALERQCFLKTKTNQPTPCPIGYTCGVIPKKIQFDYTIYPYVNTTYCFYAYATTNFDYTTPTGRLICTSSVGTVTISTRDTFIAGSRASLRCEDQEYNGKINWYKDFRPFSTVGLNAELSFNNTTLSFFGLRGRLNNGVYTCENELDNGQIIYSTNHVVVQVQEILPSVPIATSAAFTGLHSKQSPSILIRFYVNQFALPVDCIKLYYDNQDFSFSNQNKTYCSSTLAGGSIVINDPFDCSHTFYLVAINSVGSSPPGNFFDINPKSECEEPPKYEPPKTYLTGFIVSISAAGVLLIVSAVLIYTRFSQKKQINP